MKKFQTEQEAFWAGKFGNDYNDRNKGEQFLANQLSFFSKILGKTRGVKSVMEFGGNIGMNMRAIRALLPEAELSTVELNEAAVKELKKWKEGKVKVYLSSMFDWKVDYKRDFVFTKGVLIHTNPEKLNEAYDLLYKTSNKYVMIGEYFNPVPMTMDYRSNTERLWKRDFCGELMGRHKDLKLVDYGFVYAGDPNFKQDNIFWFLLQK